jgi:peptidyl-tRNA hydrolase, PTH1 family
MIKLIIGLGNPGKEYEQTRHNAGAWFIERLLQEANTTLKPEKKFHGLSCKTILFNQECHLLIPTTYMNLSGQAVSAIAKFYKIPPQAILVAHDDLDLAVGSLRLKQGGGHGGHNGLRDIISHLGTNDFLRLRFGIGHPGHKDRVTDHVLSKITKTDKKQIDTAIERAVDILPLILKGEMQQAMQELHTD